MNGSPLVKMAPAHQLKVSHAAGTILTNGEPFIGGGYPKTEQCYQFVKNELELRDATRLPPARYELAITTAPEATLISGVYDGSQLNGFHQLNGVEWQPLTSLPIKVYNHCRVSIESSRLLNIGGYSGGVSKYLKNDLKNMFKSLNGQLKYCSFIQY